ADPPLAAALEELARRHVRSWSRAEAGRLQLRAKADAVRIDARLEQERPGVEARGQGGRRREGRCLRRRLQRGPEAPEAEAEPPNEEQRPGEPANPHPTSASATSTLLGREYSIGLRESAGGAARSRRAQGSPGRDAAPRDRGGSRRPR